MKVALLNQNNSISKRLTTPTNEILGIKKLLNILGYDVDIISKFKDEELGILSVGDVSDINLYDKLIVVPANFNFYGGVVSEFTLQIAKLMSEYNDSIYFITTDVKIPIRTLGYAARKKKIPNYTFKKPIKIIDISTNNLRTKSQISPDIKIEWIKFFPIDRFILFIRNVDTRTTPKEYDIIYGGSFRSGMRAKAFEKYILNMPMDISTGMFGGIKEKQITKWLNNNGLKITHIPDFLGKIKSDKVIQETSKGFVTFVPNEPGFDGNLTTARLWESYLSTSVTLVDKGYDPNSKWLYNNFQQINSKQDMITKVRYLKTHNDFRLNLLKLQHQFISKFDANSYLLNLKKLLGE